MSPLPLIYWHHDTSLHFTKSSCTKQQHILHDMHIFFSWNWWAEVKSHHPHLFLAFFTVFTSHHVIFFPWDAEIEEKLSVALKSQTQLTISLILLSLHAQPLYSTLDSETTCVFPRADRYTKTILTNRLKSFLWSQVNTGERRKEASSNFRWPLRYGLSLSKNTLPWLLEV